MSKTKSIFFCRNCGNESPKWIGKCPLCNEWNTFIEEQYNKKKSNNNIDSHSIHNKPILLDEVAALNYSKIVTGDTELDQTLGGGIVPGSLILIGGEPGIGKSTLLLQLGLQISGYKVLYISGEESSQQIKLRADRIYSNTSKSLNLDFFIYTETNIALILKQAKSILPQVIIIDSIQTIYSDTIESSPGSISQIRECTAELMRLAKEHNISVFIIGHITKDGIIAGPKILEHIVDTVLQFEGDRNNMYRIIRTIKNRFGSTSNMGIYEMQSYGLIPVSNPSELLITERAEQPSGIAVACTIEGIRPFLIECQALVSPAVYGSPQRSTTGYDAKRLNMVLAILEKRCGIPLGMHDVFINIAGGIRVEDTAVDLAIAAAIISSLQDVSIAAHTCFAAELGLSGEIRGVQRIEQRIIEAQRMGYKSIIIANSNIKGLMLDNYNIKICTLNYIKDLVLEQY